MMNEEYSTLAATAALEGDRLFAQGRLDDAIAAYDKAVKRVPRQIDYRYKRALAKARSGLLTEARTELEVIVELEPEHPIYRVALEQIRKTEEGQRAPRGSAAPSQPYGWRREADPGEDEQLQGARQNAGGPVVLVVDDDEDITGAVAEHLQVEGWHVRRAHTLDEALALGTQQPVPDAVIYDYHMGEITGLEVRDELQYRLEQVGIDEPPYVMLTARNNPVTEEYTSRRGAQAYVLKARWLDPEVGLRAAVRKAMYG
jgi:CheY-like chemotaxis protein